MANQWLKQLAKHTSLAFLTGAIFIVLQLVFYYYLGQATHYQYKGSLLDLATASGTGNWALGFLSVLGLLITGFIIYLMGWIRYFIAPMFGIDKGHAPTFGKESIPAMILTLIGLGILTQFIFLGFYQFAQAMSPTTNIVSLTSLYNAFVAGQYGLGILAFFAIVVLGGLVHMVGGSMKAIESRLPHVR